MHPSSSASEEQEDAALLGAVLVQEAPFSSTDSKTSFLRKFLAPFSSTSPWLLLLEILLLIVLSVEALKLEAEVGVLCGGDWVFSVSRRRGMDRWVFRDDVGELIQTVLVGLFVGAFFLGRGGQVVVGL